MTKNELYATSEHLADFGTEIPLKTFGHHQISKLAAIFGLQKTAFAKHATKTLSLEKTFSPTSK